MKEIAVCRASKVSPEDLAFWCRAIDIQLRRDVYPVWRLYLPLGEMPLVPYGSVAALEPNSTHTIMVVDKIDDPGLGGYHSGVQAAGFAFGRSLPDSRVLSHEAIELACDPYCNLWSYDQTGQRWVAREPGDPVERDSYPIEVELLGMNRIVEVSNFVTPRWFGMANCDGTNRYDHLGLCSEPFANRGYFVTKDAHNTVSNIYASYNPGARDAANAKRTDPHSRTGRRAR